ncbi:MAG: hypothetical protein HYZ65_03525 [Burkholderiales bacterium]|nr:hypothetical protein [Burkholderiales bacterium]
MRLIAEKLGKSDKYDRLRYLRADGSASKSMMPRQGILPHDLVHYVVESRLPLQHGFTSLVARGAEVKFVMEQVHDVHKHTVEREAIQVEAIVEGLQSQLWSGVFDPAAFLAGAHSACVARNQPGFDFSSLDAEALLYQPALALQARWQALSYFESMELLSQPPPAKSY